jgi:CheY-like chemotaxis protein
MAFRIEISERAGFTIFFLSGQIEEQAVGELQRLLDLPRSRWHVVFDLKDVSLVHRQAMSFLAQCESDGVKIENCPSYVREWMEKESGTEAGLRVLIAEDHEEVRKMIVSLLSTEFQVVGAVSDGHELVDAATLLNPDVIVSDIAMPRMDGLAARKELRSQSRNYAFVFISMFQIHPTEFEEGSVGYVHKVDVFNELHLAICEIARGGFYMSKSVREFLEGP